MQDIFLFFLQIQFLLLNEIIFFYLKNVENYLQLCFQLARAGQMQRTIVVGMVTAAGQVRLQYSKIVVFYVDEVTNITAVNSF